MNELFRKVFGKKVWARFAVYTRSGTMKFDNFVGYDSVYIWSDEVKKWNHSYIDVDRDGLERYYEFLGIETH